MFKINLMGFVFILVLEYTRFLKSYPIQNNEVVKGDRLDKIEATKVIDEINQNRSGTKI
jgi:hypothetical protein